MTKYSSFKELKFDDKSDNIPMEQESKIKEFYYLLQKANNSKNSSSYNNKE
ncbi:MAG: hypothetical protein KAS71_12820 [Bacteroidales bacterium]|nr:hypothetical protein [Bacteroidales bacterium]